MGDAVRVDPVSTAVTDEVAHRRWTLSLCSHQSNTCSSRRLGVRTYAPAATEAVLERLLEEPSLERAVKHHAHIPARDAVTAAFPSWLDARIVAGLEGRGITSLYSHQAEAVEAVHAGEDIVVVTPTASGKTLCYALPVLQALAEDPSARAL